MYEPRFTPRFIVTATHGEACSLFHVVDTDAPEEERPAIEATFFDRATALDEAAYYERQYRHALPGRLA